MEFFTALTQSFAVIFGLLVVIYAFAWQIAPPATRQELLSALEQLKEELKRTLGK